MRKESVFIMKPLCKQSFVSILIIASLALLPFCLGQIPSSLEPLLHDMTAIMHTVDGHDDEITKLIYETRITMNELQETIEKETGLEQKASIQMQKIKKKLEQELKNIHNQTETTTLSMQDAFKQEIVNLHRQAATRTLQIIDKAEQMVLKATTKKPYTPSLNIVETLTLTNQEEATPIIANPIILDEPENLQQPLIVEKKPITQEWKNDIATKFYERSSYLNNIINKGESAKEAQDFEQRFSEQNKWFDQTLTATQFFYDQPYTSITEKYAELNNITTAHKIATTMLNKHTESLQFSTKELEKIKLLLLYDLYDKLPETALQQNAPWASTTLTQKTIDETVKKALYHLQPSPGFSVGTLPSIVTAQEPKKDIEMSQKEVLKEVRNIFEENRKTYEEMKKITQEREQKAEEHLKKIAEQHKSTKANLESQLKKTDNSLEEIHKAHQELLNKKGKSFVPEQKTVHRQPQQEQKTTSDESKKLNNALLRIQKEIKAKEVLQSKIEAIDKKNKELEILLRKSTATSDKIHQENVAVLKKTIGDIKRELTSMIETKTKENLNLELHVKQSDNKISLLAEQQKNLFNRLKTAELQTTTYKKEMQDQKNIHIEISSRAQLQEAYTDKALQEMRQHLEHERMIISNLLTEKKKQLSQEKAGLVQMEQRLMEKSALLEHEDLLIQKKNQEIAQRKKG